MTRRELAPWSIAIITAAAAIAIAIHDRAATRRADAAIAETRTARAAAAASESQLAAAQKQLALSAELEGKLIEELDASREKERVAVAQMAEATKLLNDASAAGEETLRQRKAQKSP